jgi:tRNA(fMet)-specific endonuclease VapC
MRSILIDTNAHAAFKRGDAEAVAVVQRAPLIALNAIVLGELLGGFASGSREADNRRELDRFLGSPRVALLPLDRHTAEVYAATHAALKKAAKPIPTNDLWIAASAIQHGLALFTFDRHFHVVPGLHTGATAADIDAG